MHLHLLIATFTFFTELVMTAPLLTDPSEVVITLSDNGLIQADSDVHTPERRYVTSAPALEASQLIQLGT